MSESTTSLDEAFEWLANVYNINGAINHPSELHGLIVGELSGGLLRHQDSWLDLALEHMGVEHLNIEKQPNLKEDLYTYYQDVASGIEQDSSAFGIMLPDDDYPLTERVEALGLWVRGFLEGIAIAANTGLNQVDDDLKEILQDLVDISQLDARTEGSETGEKELFEVSEYVRIGVLNLYAEFNEPDLPEQQDEAPQPTLH